jgi:hypothetical protein
VQLHQIAAISPAVDKLQAKISLAAASSLLSIKSSNKQATQHILRHVLRRAPVIVAGADDIISWTQSRNAALDQVVLFPVHRLCHLQHSLSFEFSNLTAFDSLPRPLALHDIFTMSDKLKNMAMAEANSARAASQDVLKSGAYLYPIKVCQPIPQRAQSHRAPLERN